MAHHPNSVSLLVNSERRTTGTNENFALTISPPILFVNRVIITGYSIPVSFYNINSTNNTLIYTDDIGVDESVTITPGNYTGESLATALEDGMNAGISVSFDNATFKFTFVYTGVLFELKTNVAPPGNILSTLFPLLGFNTTVNQTGATTYTSDQIANLAKPRYIQIKSSLISDSKLISNMINGSFSETIYTIFPGIDFGCTLIKQDLLHEIIYKSDFNISSIDLRLEDENNNVLDLNGQPWCITFDFRVS